MTLNKLIFFFTIILFMALSSCQKAEPILVSDAQLEKRLSSRVWKQSNYSDKPNYAYWEFSKGDINISVVNRKSGKTVSVTKGTYEIGRKFMKGVYFRILTIGSYDQALPGKYEPLRVNKKVLKFAKNGREDDGNETTIEGGLVMLEFTKD